MSSLTIFSFLFLLGYLLGSIPFGYLISKAKGIDIRKVGSGNTGATNVSRALGLKTALLVGFLDFSKGIPTLLLAQKFLNNNWLVIVVALASTLGHVFPFWLNFKGGKGVGTTAGVLLVFLGWKIFLIFMIIWVVALSVLKIMSLTNLILILFLPPITWFVFHSPPHFVWSIIIACLIWWTHRENIRRLITHKEPKFSLKRKI